MGCGFCAVGGADGWEGKRGGRWGFGSLSVEGVEDRFGGEISGEGLVARAPVAEHWF